MSEPFEARWVRTAPTAFDIVACWYPEADGSGPKLRPALVIRVLQNRETKLFACKVAYGTSNLKLTLRGHLDLIIQNSTDLSQFGLPKATRFDLDATVLLPWNQRFFGTWRGRSTPVIGSLTEDYVKDFAFKVISRNTR